MSAQSMVARKYATAFLNVFIDELSFEDIQRTSAATDFLARNKTVLYFLSWPVIDMNSKIKALHEMVRKFSLHHSFEKLIALLAADRRMECINAVLFHICSEYMVRKNIVRVDISSSHQLSPADIKTIEQFLVNITGLSIIYDYKIDKKLIAGIRLQSKTFLWEYSIHKQLNQMKLPLIR